MGFAVATELERNRRSAHLIANLASRLPGGAHAFRSAYLLLAGLFLVGGVYYVLAGHPLGGAISYELALRSSCGRLEGVHRQRPEAPSLEMRM